MHFLHRIKILLPVIVCLKFVTFAQGNKLKNADKCTHGGILSGVFLDAGVRPRNDTIFSDIKSMEDCIEKCCKISKCDLAMKIGKVCHAVRCQDENSCQISHRHQGSKVRAMIAFITKGEEIQSEPQTKPTKAATKFSATANNHQSTINKKPTIALIPGIQTANTKAVNTKPVLQIPRKESPKLGNFVDTAFNMESGSGAADETNEEEDQVQSTSTEGESDDEDDSGSTSISSGESSGLAGGSTRDEMDSKGVKIASRTEESYVLPSVVKVNSKLPSASRSAIPMASEQHGVSIGLPFITYSHDEDSSDSERDDKGQDAVSYDDDDDDDEDDDGGDDDDNDESTFKKPTEVVSNRNAVINRPSQRKLATTKSSAYLKTRTHVLTGLKHKMKPSEIFAHGNRQNTRLDKFVSKMNKFHGKTYSSHGNEGNKQVIVMHTENHKDKAKQGHDYRGMEASRAVKVDTDDKMNQVARKLTDKESKRLKAKDSSTGKLEKDYNDVTRAVIMKRKGNSGDNSNAKVVAHEMKSKKAAVTTSPQQPTKVSYTETRLQKELSTLFAKDQTKINRSSFINPSKKSSFESVKKLQEERDKKRHRSKGHTPSLYQILNIPRETAKCKRGVTIHGATLRGGILAGDFKTIGIVDNQHTCVSSCCKNKRCDVALMLGKECFNVKCYSSNLCGLAPATAIFDEVTPIITYVRGHIQKRSAEDQDEQVDEELIDEPVDEHTQLLKWLKIFI